ncbi:hypothetical protein Q8F55_008455 [Vanrija albida]|uniref:F-box domain-containing protein n=1 Tax=Vanrija albida TaxID=181172 RepID=A0ABR3PQV4_9TREE
MPTPTAVSTVLQDGGYDHITEYILLHLGDDWRSVLAASATCRHLNALVVGSAALQLILRCAYYGRLGQVPAQAAGGRARLIDVERRWAALAPRRIDTVDLDQRFALHDGTSMAVSDGLVVIGTLPDTASYDGSPFSSPEVGMDSWTVHDFTNHRDGGHVPKVRVHCGLPFAGVAISRSDGLIAVFSIHKAVSEPVLSPTGRPSYRNSVDAAVHLFQLSEPGEATRPLDTDFLDATPHPDSPGLIHLHAETVKYFSFNQRPPYSLSTNLSIVGDTILVSSMALDSRDRLFNWRTGQEINRGKGDWQGSSCKIVAGRHVDLDSLEGVIDWRRYKSKNSDRSDGDLLLAGTREDFISGRRIIDVFEFDSEPSQSHAATIRLANYGPDIHLSPFGAARVADANDGAELPELHEIAWPAMQWRQAARPEIGEHGEDTFSEDSSSEDSFSETHRHSPPFTLPPQVCERDLTMYGRVQTLHADAEHLYLTVYDDSGSEPGVKQLVILSF